MNTNTDEPDPAARAASAGPALPAPVDAAADDDGDATGRARALLRSTAPSEHMATVLDLEAGSGELSDARRHVLGGVEELTGLRAGELHALVAVADGADHHREVARRTGQADAAAAATVDGLVSKELLGRHHHPAERNEAAAPTLVHLTSRGHAVLGQSEALRVRLLDRIVGTLEGGGLTELQATADEVHRTLSAAIPTAQRQIGGSNAS